MRIPSASLKEVGLATAFEIAVPNAFIPLTVCLRRTRSSERNARLSQTNTREPAAKPSGKLLSTELRTPTDRPTPCASGVSRSRTPKNRASDRASAYFSALIWYPAPWSVSLTVARTLPWLTGCHRPSGGGVLQAWSSSSVTSRPPAWSMRSDTIPSQWCEEPMRQHALVRAGGYGATRGERNEGGCLRVG